MLPVWNADRRRDATRLARKCRGRSSRQRPQQPYAAVRYKGHWFWIDQSDWRTTRTLVLVILLFTLTDPHQGAALRRRGHSRILAREPPRPLRRGAPPADRERAPLGRGPARASGRPPRPRCAPRTDDRRRRDPAARLTPSRRPTRSADAVLGYTRGRGAQGALPREHRCALRDGPDDLRRRRLLGRRGAIPDDCGRPFQKTQKARPQRTRVPALPAVSSAADSAQAPLMSSPFTAESGVSGR